MPVEIKVKLSSDEVDEIEIGTFPNNIRHDTQTIYLKQNECIISIPREAVSQLQDILNMVGVYN